jgi:AraC-like DNA-binding protein
MKTELNSSPPSSPIGPAKDRLFYGFRIREPAEWPLYEPQMPHSLASGGIFLCLRGEADFFLDLKRYRLRAGDMCLAFPFSIVQTMRLSPDFAGFGVGVAVELFDDINIPSLTDYYLYIKDNPCISLSASEQKMLTGFCRYLLLRYERADHPFRLEIANSLFRVIYCEIAAIYMRGQPIVHEAVSRKDMLFRKFLFLISKHSRRQRNVGYYADQLCVTARHLSATVKEKSGLTALAWINGLVIRQAKSLLEDRNLSIQQVADELRFTNPSFFGQYFKRETGLTPKEFRNRGKCGV